MSFDLDAYLALLRARVDRALADKLPPVEAKDPLRLREAMSAALLEGGKRLRPCLTIASCQAVGGDPERAVAAACAVEMVHAYSLVHDDLPALDNDELRRGKPTCHKRFGETAAILAGDALLTLAFEVITDEHQPASAAARCQAAYELARAAGARGLVGGQALDMQLQGARLQAEPTAGRSFASVELCDSGKTAALFSACTAIGALVGDGDETQLEHLRSYGFDFGLAFQHADDLEDDAFPEHRSRSRERGVALARRAADTARRFGERGAALAALAEQLARRIAGIKTENAPTPAGG